MFSHHGCLTGEALTQSAPNAPMRCNGRSSWRHVLVDRSNIVPISLQWHATMSHHSVASTTERDAAQGHVIQHHRNRDMYGLRIGVDLAGLLGGRMASAEGGSVSSGVAYGERCPLSSWLRGLGERRELPRRDPGRSPGRKRILAYFEGHRTLIFVLIWRNLGGGTICISVLPLQILGRGTCPPLSPPWSTPMGLRVTTLMHLVLGRYIDIRDISMRQYLLKHTSTCTRIRTRIIRFYTDGR